MSAGRSTQSGSLRCNPVGVRRVVTVEASKDDRMRAVVLVLVAVLAGSCSAPDVSDGSVSSAVPSASGDLTPTAPPPTVKGPVDPPPPAWVVTGSVTRWMAYGSYCWDSDCVDMVPPDQLPDVPSIVAPVDATVKFHLGFRPSRVELIFPGDERAVTLEAGREVEWQVTRTGTVMVGTWRPGGGDAFYVVELLASGPDQ